MLIEIAVDNGIRFDSIPICTGENKKYDANKMQNNLKA